MSHLFDLFCFVFERRPTAFIGFHCNLKRWLPFLNNPLALTGQGSGLCPRSPALPGCGIHNHGFDKLTPGTSGLALVPKYQQRHGEFLFPACTSLLSSGPTHQVSYRVHHSTAKPRRTSESAGPKLNTFSSFFSLRLEESL